MINKITNKYYKVICEDCNKLIASYNHEPQNQQTCSNCIAWIENEEIETDINYKNNYENN